MDDLIYRHFTTGNENVYNMFKWKTVNVKINDYSTGKPIFEMNDLEFPESYSQSACDIIASKYFRKKGVNNERGHEYSMKQVVHRMVSFWCDALTDEAIITEKQILYDELAYMLLAQMWAPNSPQWFNTGIKQQYDISGRSQGHYYYDPISRQAVEAEDAYTRTQGSACFITHIEDSLLGEKSLTDQLTTEALLFKYGSGVGTNWSNIRAVNEFLSGGGKSSGLIRFLRVSDRSAGAIKSGGTTRRAAKMNILNLDHPEILDFIKWKEKEERKAEALGKMGYSTHFEGEAYDTVSGQNANNSVRIPDSFMKLLGEADTLWQLKGRVDSSVDKKISVSELWDAIAEAAWRCGDPGVQFDDIINSWHTCPCGEDGDCDSQYNRINASNPCSEYMFLDDTACNLASINLAKYYNADTEIFDVESYLHSIKLIQLVLEATIHWGQFPTKYIARRSYKFRTTGLGYTNLGMLLMTMALPYDCEKSRNIAAALMSLMTGYSYYISSQMAKKVGAFECYALNEAHMLRVMRNHARAAGCIKNDYEGVSYKPIEIDNDIIRSAGFENISEALEDVWARALESAEKYGCRNAQVSVLAPTGTIALAMDCATTSSEPFFSHVTYKKLAGGSHMIIANDAIAAALKKLGYKDEHIKDIISYVMRKDEYEMAVDGKIEGAPHLKEEHLSIFDTASKCGTGLRYISPEAHVKMMGTLAPHVSGAISKTVNMPNEATPEDIKMIYELSWKLGVKSIALYRDGCKASQPLNAVTHTQKEKSLDDYSYFELLEYAKNLERKPLRVKPKGIRNARVHEAQIDGLKLYITTSFYEDGRLGEIYVSSGRQGSLVKGLLDSISTTISEMLQYGVPAVDIAKMYRGQKYEPSGFVSGHPYIKSIDSISDLISKIIDIELGDYSHCQVKPRAIVAEPKVSFDFSDIIHGEVCSICKSDKLVKSGTCKICIACGSTTGCS